MKRTILLTTLVACCIASSCSRTQPRTVLVSDFITEEMIQAEDAYPAVRAALEECLKQDGSTLVLPGGTLPIKDRLCYEQFLRISNNDPSSKRIAFLIKGAKGLTVEGNGTLLLFSGFITPFYIENSSDVTIKNLNIDYTRTHHSEGTIMATGKDWVEVKFPQDYNVKIQSGILTFKDEDGVTYPYANLLEFDSVKKEVAHYVHDYWIWGGGIQAEKLPNGNFRILREGFEGTPGNILVFGARARLCPCFTLDGVEGFNLKDVNIWHCGGMGVIAQRSRDIELSRVQVVPSPGKDRMISITADATHFINCKGYIRMLDCTFTNQKDDATNIHGWYSVAGKKVSENSLELWSNYGMDFARPGMNLEIVDHNTMMTYDTLRVIEVYKYNDEYSLVSFDGPIPDNFSEKDILADADANPDVLIKGCYFGGNRARGLLIGSRGKVVIEENTFHVPGTAILFEGDGNYWYEQSGVRDVTIRKNLFKNCLYGSKTWGPAYIATGSGIPQREGSIYHKNILIEDNTFDTFDPRILNLYCTDGLIFRGNKIIPNTDYEFSRPSESFITKDCLNVEIEQ